MYNLETLEILATTQTTAFLVKILWQVSYPNLILLIFSIINILKGGDWVLFLTNVLYAWNYPQNSFQKIEFIHEGRSISIDYFDFKETLFYELNSLKGT